MAEREIRAAIERFRTELDRRPRNAVLPLMLTAGLAVAACSEDVETEPSTSDGGSTATGQTSTSSGTATGSGGSGGISATGGSGGAGATGSGAFGGAILPPYMAPDAG